MEAKDLQEGYYDAKPICWGFTETKSGVPQYSVEFEVTVHTEAGPEAVSVLHKQGFSNDKSIEILVEQLRVCGWTGSDFGTVELDTNNIVRINLVHDEYGAKVKGVYAKSNESAVKRYALKDDKRKQATAELNERLRQMGLAAPATSPVSVANPAHPSNASKPAAPARTAPAPRPAAPPAARPAQAPRATQPAQRPAAKPAQRPAQQAQAEDGGWFEPPAEAAPEEQPF